MGAMCDARSSLRRLSPRAMLVMSSVSGDLKTFNIFSHFKGTPRLLTRDETRMSQYNHAGIVHMNQKPQSACR
jgi:hypothetical protein